MAWIDSHLEKFIIENFPDRKYMPTMNIVHGSQADIYM
jgi:hypothetical protein